MVKSLNNNLILKEILEATRRIASGGTDVFLCDPDKFSLQELSDLRYLFDEFDSKEKGKLTFGELADALRVLRIEETKIDSLIKLPELNNIEINFEVFLTLIDKIQGSDISPLEMLKVCFDQIDCERRGSISLEELEKCCLDNDLKFKRKFIAEIFHEADLNRNGLIDFNELKT